MADGFAEQLSDFGVWLLVPGPGGRRLRVLPVVDPVAGFTAMDAGDQETFSAAYDVDRADVLAARLAPESACALEAAPKRPLRVKTVSDDGTGDPAVRITLRELR